MNFTVVQEYPAGLDRLWTALGQPDYPRRKYHALGATAVRVRRFHATARSIEVELERDVPVRRAQLPLWARPLVGREQTLRHRSSWQRTSPRQVEARLDIEPIGLPVRAHGVGSIVEVDPGLTRITLSWEVDSALGARVAAIFAEQVRTSLDEDHAFTLTCLPAAAGDRSP